MTRTRTRRRVGAWEARRAQRNKRAAGSVSASLRGGTYKPLSDRDIERVHQTALDVLEKVGMGNPPPILRERALARGCWVDDHDRLCFPRTLVEDVIAAMPREIVMHGLDPDYDMESSAGRVIFAPGGDAVTTLDVDKRSYRSSTLVDVYDFARLIDWLEHVHEFTPVVVATDIQDLRAANLNSAYAAISGTSKHVCLSPNTVTDVDDIIELMNLIAGGEQALLGAAAAQMGLYYGIPASVGAGMSDAKWPDAQAGFEKGVTVTAAALAGGDVSEVAGMMASLMGCSFEAMVIDNDMLGNIARVLRGIEVTEETLSFETIRDVVRGPGHYLGHSQTLSLMESEYIYPGISDRRSYGEWEETGRLDIVDAAQARVREILSTHYPGHIDPATDRKIRERFDILLPEDAMRPGNGRW